METSSAKKNGTDQKEKKRTPRPKKIIPVKFDKEGFYLTWGLAIVCIGLGILLIWATKTAPDGNTETMALSTSQRIARLLPQSTKETLAFIMGGLFTLFGIVCAFLGTQLVVKYFIAKSKELQ
jgi:hypothetical protein